MYQQSVPDSGWNLFARVLQEILAVRGLGLGHLDDRAGVHPEKVRRLQRSLKTPKSFPLLTLDEMDDVIAVFKLTRQERIRLRAAILTTSIEATLMSRINVHDALIAAEQILPIIEQALYDHAGQVSGLAIARSDSQFIMGEENEIERMLEEALASLDRATLTLHLSRYGETQAERLERVRQAQSSFKLALAHFERAEDHMKQTATWQEWYQETQSGLVQTEQRLASADS